MKIRSTYSVKDVDLRFVDEECFEEQCHHERGLAENEESAVEPCACSAVEESEEGDLRQICESEEDGEDEDRHQEAWEQPGSQERVEVWMLEEIDQSLWMWVLSAYVLDATVGCGLSARPSCCRLRLTYPDGIEPGQFRGMHSGACRLRSLRRRRRAHGWLVDYLY